MRQVVENSTHYPRRPFPSFRLVLAHTMGTQRDEREDRFLYTLNGLEPIKKAKKTYPSDYENLHIQPQRLCTLLTSRQRGEARREGKCLVDRDTHYRAIYKAS